MRTGQTKYMVALMVALAVQAAAYYAAELRSENLPAFRPLTSFPNSVEGWRSVKEFETEKEVLDVLKADDTLSRIYVDQAQVTGVSLFVAFFKTQRTGQAPHSPKNCLPGSGWEPSESSIVTVPVSGGPQPTININRYVVSRGDERSAVFYWYQSHGRVIAGESAAKFWLVADSIRLHRSDTALVRVVVGVRNNDVEGAAQAGIRFIQASFPELVRQLNG